MLRHEGVGNLAVFTECAGGAYLIEAHEPRVAGHVGCDYCVRYDLVALAPWPSCRGYIILPEMLPDATLGLGRCAVNKWNPWLPKENASLPALRRPPSSMAPPLLKAPVRGERVPKQTSAEATNGKLVST